MPDTNFPALANLASLVEEQLSPDYQHFIHALRSVGYSFEESVADIVDNSIDAGASDILIRFVICEDSTVDLLISDNGSGMTADELRRAMIFGTQPVENRQQRLGKFGLGLKMASIAQAVDLHVISLKNGELSGRAWTGEGLKKGFFCSLLNQAFIDGTTRLNRLPLEEEHGTWVLWKYLHRHESAFGKPDRLCDQLILGLCEHLGLHLHRFLDKISIEIDMIDHKGHSGARRKVKPYHPFGYTHSGCDGYPVELVPAGSYSGKLRIRAHIWPPKSSSPNYKLPGGAVKRQGLYFYRNDRLISGGGWYEIRDGLDSHDSLGRVEIDIGDTELEREVSIDVRKALVKVTPALRESIINSKSPDGVSFKDFLKDSNKTYRASGGGGAGPLGVRSALVPASASLPERLRELIGLFAGGTQGAIQRDFHFKWEPFDAPDGDLFFRLLHRQNVCLLNEKYRSFVLAAAEEEDRKGMLLQMLLFLLVGDYCEKEKLSSKDEQWLEGLGKLMSVAADAELGLKP
jgi:hypothetical protein